MALTLTYNNMKLDGNGNQLEAYSRTMRAHSLYLPPEFKPVRDGVWQKEAKGIHGLTVIETWRVYQEAA